ncbi:hypothetical protein GGR56DRAFT_685560 [Xylariaceae sp. FL0804]|nr:hypothetical protein GGR56DRAFT_685560 [Xylariaceae sp. FL0804]
MAYNSNHPLPAPPPPGYPSQHLQQHPSPQQQQHQPLQQFQPSTGQPQQRTRPKSRAFSFRSDKSANSQAHPNKQGKAQETSAEKESKRLHTHADPRMALNEMEPSMRAQEENTYASLRSIQHKDPTGSPISDPDRSNPTRSRWERPLDTIRSFEAAIDGGYSSRKSIYRSDTDLVANWNRRSGFFGGAETPRFPQDSYYGGRPASIMRPDSAMFDPRQSMMSGGPRDSYYEGPGAGSYGGGGPGQRNRFSRNQSEPHLGPRGYPDRNVYPVPNNHRSYETVASGTGSGSYGEPNGYQTDPTSSENSSIDRRSPPKRQEPVNDYGITFGQTPAYQSSSLGLGNGSGGPPNVPRKDNGGTLRKPAAAAMPPPQQRPAPAEKRKSWLMRRFSKNS